MRTGVPRRDSSSHCKEEMSKQRASESPILASRGNGFLLRCSSRGGRF